MSASSPSFVFRHPPAALLQLTGEDTLAFLQGQFTQELRHPTGARAAYGLWLNQKGRVLGDSVALRQGARWRLYSDETAAAALKERLESYIIADDVAVEDETQTWAVVTFGGAEIEAAAAAAGVEFPGDGLHLELEQGLLFRSRRAGAGAWALLLPKGAPEPGWLAGRSAGPGVDVSRRRIRSGWPAVPSELGPSDLPNEGGLEDVAVSYTKGCYLGQEVMARLKSMGQVRRRLRAVGADTTAPATLPAPVYAGGKPVGELRSAFPTEDGSGFIGMAMLTLLGLDPTQLLALAAEGPPVVRLLGSGGTAP